MRAATTNTMAPFVAVFVGSNLTRKRKNRKNRKKQKARLHLFVFMAEVFSPGFSPTVSPNPPQIVCDELHHSGRGANRKSPRKGKICDPPSPADLPQLRRIAVASDASDTMQCCCMARKIFHGLQQSEGTCLHPNHIAHSANAKLQDIASGAMQMSMQSQVLHHASPLISKGAPARRRTTAPRDIERHSIKPGIQWRLCMLFKYVQMKLGEGHVPSVAHCLLVLTSHSLTMFSQTSLQSSPSFVVDMPIISHALLGHLNL